MTTAAFPPTRHMMRDLGLEVDGLDGSGGGRARLALRPALADATGGVRIGAVATLVDALGGGLVGLAVAPNWMATMDLTVHLAGRVPVDGAGLIEADGRVLRAGRSTAVLEVDLSAGGGPVGIATMTFAVLTHREENPTMDAWRRPYRFGADGVVDEPGPWTDALGIRPVADRPGAVELPMTPYVTNTLGAVQGGALATLIESGALAAVAEGDGGPWRAVQLEVNYLSFVKRGPARTCPRVLHLEPSRAIVAVDVIDHGNDDRTTTLGRVVLEAGTPS